LENRLNAEDAKLKLAVATAVDELKKARAGVTPPFRLAIIDLVGGSPLRWGAHEPDTMDFIASEAKIHRPLRCLRPS
jgi:hypothetical protein